MIHLTDADVMRMLTPTAAVSVMEQVFLARAQGTVYGKPRWGVEFGRGKDIVFTTGAVGDAVGMRTYLRGDLDRTDQLVAVWDAQTGALKGIITGVVLGSMRTGAIGGVAVKHLARFEAQSLGLVGTGRQAFTQIQAVLASRAAINSVKVYSRTPENRQAFVDDIKIMRPNLEIRAVDSAQEAVEESDIVIGATNSREPVIKGAWLKAGAHVTTVGPKYATERETDAEVVARADFIATDSPEQCAQFPNGLLTDGTGKQVYDLAAAVSGQLGRPSEDAITLFISTGLAGTEVALGDYLLRRYAQQAADA